MLTPLQHVWFNATAQHLQVASSKLWMATCASHNGHHPRIAVQVTFTLTSRIRVSTKLGRCVKPQVKLYFDSSLSLQLANEPEQVQCFVTVTAASHAQNMNFRPNLKNPVACCTVLSGVKRPRKKKWLHQHFKMSPPESLSAASACPPCPAYLALLRQALCLSEIE